MTQQLPDLQNKRDTRGVRIHKVGISQYRMPVTVWVKGGNYLEVISTVSAYISVEEKLKGANMSRFVAVLMECVRSTNDDVSIGFVARVCKELKERHEAIESYAKVRFPYWTTKQSPVSKLDSFSTHDCELEGQIKLNPETGRLENHMYLTVEVDYMSCCPCSKEMSLMDTNAVPADMDVDKRPGWGAHMQRSVAKVKIHLRDPLGENADKIVWIEDIADIVNRAASCEIFNILKRPDEKWVTEEAYANPKFCEDVVRDIGIELDGLSDVIDGFVVVTEHQESIHQYNAISVLRGGFYIE